VVARDSIAVDPWSGIHVPVGTVGWDGGTVSDVVPVCDDEN
jgi:hypothetical protein